MRHNTKGWLGWFILWSVFEFVGPVVVTAHSHTKPHDGLRFAGSLVQPRETSGDEPGKRNRNHA